MHGLEAAAAAAVAGEAAARGAVGASARAAESIAFRRRLLEADGPGGGSDAPDGQLRGDYSTVSAAAAAAAAAQAAAHAAHEVPHSLLIQARQERSLVDLMLRRYRRGEAGHYCEDLSALGECAAPVGASYPGRYYNKVKVCVNCYRVYKLMDSRRAEAVSKLTAHSNGHSNGHSNRHSHTAAAATAAMTAKLVPTDAAYSATESDTGTTDTTATAPATAAAAAAAAAAALAALSRARAAMACVTAGDIAELRTFAKPPPAVRMAAAAMMLLLTGAGDATAAGWAAARRYCSFTY
jgi:hypothetical protein